MCDPQIHPGSPAHSLSRLQISTMAVKDNLMVAGGYHGELVCKVFQWGKNLCTSNVHSWLEIVSQFSVFSSTWIVLALNSVQKSPPTTLPLPILLIFAKSPSKNLKTIEQKYLITVYGLVWRLDNLFFSVARLECWLQTMTRKSGSLMLRPLPNLIVSPSHGLST